MRHTTEHTVSETRRCVRSCPHGLDHTPSPSFDATFFRASTTPSPALAPAPPALAPERVPAPDGHEVFVLRSGSEGPTILLLPGFPSSSCDWRALLHERAIRERDVLALDFLGFGLSDKPPGPYSLMTQADLVQELVARHINGRVFLVAHDVGTSGSRLSGTTRRSRTRRRWRR